MKRPEVERSLAGRCVRPNSSQGVRRRSPIGDSFVIPSLPENNSANVSLITLMFSRHRRATWRCENMVPGGMVFVCLPPNLTANADKSCSLIISAVRLFAANKVCAGSRFVEKKIEGAPSLSKSLFRNILPITPLKSKIWRGISRKLLIPKDRDMGEGGQYPPGINVLIYRTAARLLVMGAGVNNDYPG
jgi:hypothetical protein